MVWKRLTRPRSSATVAGELGRQMNGERPDRSGLAAAPTRVAVSADRGASEPVPGGRTAPGVFALLVAATVVGTRAVRAEAHRYETFSVALRAAYATAGLDYPAGLRPCHDLRVTSITNDVLAGAHPVAIMTKAGHANMTTTKRYLKLAGVVFRDEADALERRLLGEPSTRLSAPEPISPDPASLNHVVLPQPTGSRRTSSSSRRPS